MKMLGGKFKIGVYFAATMLAHVCWWVLMDLREFFTKLQNLEYILLKTDVNKLL